MRLRSGTTMRAAAIVLLASLMLVAMNFVPELDSDLVETAVDRMGPVAIVLLVALGIVVIPIPSGAIALVAGALYGTWHGGALTIRGAESVELSGLESDGDSSLPPSNSPPSIVTPRLPVAGGGAGSSQL